MKTDRELLADALDYIERLTETGEKLPDTDNLRVRPAARRNFNLLAMEAGAWAAKIRNRWETEEMQVTWPVRELTGSLKAAHARGSFWGRASRILRGSSTVATCRIRWR